MKKLLMTLGIALFASFAHADTGDIFLSSNFQENSGRPLDARITVSSATARLALTSVQVYDGMMVYQRSDKTTWQLQGSTYTWIQIIPSTSSSTGYSIYPATATASFPFGLTASTMTVSTQTVTGEIILKDGTIITSTSTFGGGSASPAFPLNSVQFNSTGTFNGSTHFTTDGSSVAVSTITGVVSNFTSGYQQGVFGTILNQRIFGNLAVGGSAESNSLSGVDNTAVGYTALNALTSGSDNTAIGLSALDNDIGGIQNSAVGSSALLQNVSGNNNTANGFESLQNTTASGNTGFGYESLLANFSGTNNTALGFSANVGANNLTNATAIGASATVQASNTVRLGASGTVVSMDTATVTYGISIGSITGAGLTSCSGPSNAVTYFSSGTFGCNAITGGGVGSGLTYSSFTATAPILYNGSGGYSLSNTISLSSETFTGASGVLVTGANGLNVTQGIVASTLSVTDANINNLTGAPSTAFFEAETSATSPSSAQVFASISLGAWANPVSSPLGIIGGTENEGISLSTSTVSNIYGSANIAENTGTGTATKNLATLSNAFTQSGSKTTSQYGNYITNYATNGSTVTNNYEIFISSPIVDFNSVMTNNYGIYIDSQNLPGSASDYGIYQLLSPNYFGGTSTFAEGVKTSTLQVTGMSGGGTQCVQVDNNGNETGTGVACGSGSGGGTSALGVNFNGVSVTSPTAQINFTGNGVSVVANGSTATVTIAGSSGGYAVAPATVTFNLAVGVIASTLSVTATGTGQAPSFRVGPSTSSFNSFDIGTGTQGDTQIWSLNPAANVTALSVVRENNNASIGFNAAGYFQATETNSTGQMTYNVGAWGESDGFVTNTGTATLNFGTVGQSEMHTGTSTIMGGLTSIVQIDSNAYAQNAIGVYVPTIKKIATGRVDNAYGIFVQDQTTGTISYAIKTGLGQVALGDNTIIGNSSLEDISLGTITDATTYGGIKFGNTAPTIATYNIAGNGTDLLLNSPSGKISLNANNAPELTMATNGAILISSSMTVAGIRDTAITGATQCLHADTNGNVTGTGSDCGSGGGGSGIVSPGTFTWVNNQGIIVSTFQATAFNSSTTSMTVTGSGGFAVMSSSAGQIALTQGADSTVIPVSGSSTLWASTSSGTLVFTNGVGVSTYTVGGTSTTITPGHFLIAGTNAGSYLDGGTGSGGGIAAAYRSGIIGESWDGTGSALTTGTTYWVRMSSFTSANLVGFTLTGTPSGSMSVNVSSSSLFNTAPVSICASQCPSFTTSTSSSNYTLNGWTTSIGASGYVYFIINSASTVTQANLSIDYLKP